MILEQLTEIQSLARIWIVFMAAVAFLCFIVSEITRNYSQIDKLWSLMPIAYSWITAATFPSARLFIMAALVTAWGLRLSYNFSRKGGYSLIPWKGEEDYRWKVMRENPFLKGRLRFGLFNFFFISFYQNILILLFSTPLLLAAGNQDKPLTIIDLLATAFMMTFIIIEGIADNHLFRFHQKKKSGENGSGRFKESLRKGFMTEGLWKYVRHPNFTSEQLIWISFYFFGVAASGQWINFTLAGPIMLILLFIGSSQLTESISSRKYPEYAIYKKEVSRFIPWKFLSQALIKDSHKATGSALSES